MACCAQVLGDLLVYPNRMSFDIMEGGGKAPEPVGLLVVKVKAVTNIRGGGDLFSKARPAPRALSVQAASFATCPCLHHMCRAQHWLSLASPLPLRAPICISEHNALPHALSLPDLKSERVLAWSYCPCPCCITQQSQHCARIRYNFLHAV